MKINIFKNKFINYISTEQSLAKHTWFGVGGNAQILYIPDNEISFKI